MGKEKSVASRISLRDVHEDDLTIFFEQQLDADANARSKEIDEVILELGKQCQDTVSLFGLLNNLVSLQISPRLSIMPVMRYNLPY